MSLILSELNSFILARKRLTKLGSYYLLALMRGIFIAS